MSDVAQKSPAKMGFSPICVIIICVIAWIGVAAAVITLIVLGGINLGTTSKRSENIETYNTLALNWTTSKDIFKSYWFSVNTDFVQGVNVTVDDTNEVPNDTPSTGEFFRQFPSFKYSSAPSFPLIVNQPFVPSSSVIRVTISYAKSPNGPWNILPSFKVPQYYLDNKYLLGSNAAITCANTYQGYYQGLNSCLVYYTLNQICVLFDSTNGILAPGGCGMFNAHIDPKGSFSPIDSTYARSTTPMSFNGPLVIREVRDPHAFLISLQCGMSFCESQISYIIYGLFEIGIAASLLVFFVCVPITISICWWCGICGKIYHAAIKDKGIKSAPKPQGYYERQVEEN